MKKSVLKIVQDILNDMDSDEVNSIDDTIESQQVASILEQTYYEMMGNRNWPHTRKLFQLEPSGDLDKPNYLRLPEGLKELVFFKYEKQKDGDTKTVLQDVKYKEPEDFLNFISSRNSDNDNVTEVIDTGGSKILIYNNAAPQYWTSFDDTYLVCDSYDRSVDDTLRKAKTQALGYIIPQFLKVDDFIPDFPIDAFPAYIEECKSTAFYTLKQTINQKSEQKASRQQRWLARKAWRAHGGVQYQDYGRKSRK